MSIPKRSPRSRRTAQIDPNQSRTGISRHIANRELGADEKQQALLASALQGAANAVLFLDLDCFKNVNDALGHAAGDRLLVAVADRLRAAVAALVVACLALVEGLKRRLI